MIYEFASHSLYYEDEKRAAGVFSLLLDTLELEYDLEKGKLIGAKGYLPLVNAKSTSISLNGYKNGDIYLKNIKENCYQENATYDILDKIPEIRAYFEPLNIMYDDDNGIIQLGTDLVSDDELVKVDNNIICGIDSQANMKSIFLIPSKIVSV